MFDLTRRPDYEFEKFMGMCRGQAELRRIEGIGRDEVRAMERVADRQAETTEAIRRQTHEVRGDLQEGFRSLGFVVSWGMARVCWELEQSRVVYLDVLDTLEHPLTAQALELRERAEKAIANRWWEEAVSDLSDCIGNDRYDYLAHSQLAQVLWFEYGQWQPALEEFQWAAKYADATDADASQRY
jgi:tetratricopeptide (TPR) repeat protein